MYGVLVSPFLVAITKYLTPPPKKKQLREKGVISAYSSKEHSPPRQGSQCGRDMRRLGIPHSESGNGSDGWLLLASRLLSPFYSVQDPDP